MSESAPQNTAVVYENFFGAHMFRPWGEVLVRGVDFRPGDRVLDLACATGAVARIVAETSSDPAEVHGLDPSAAMLEVARSTAADAGLAITWSEGVAEELPYNDEQFDLILCQQALLFFQDRKRAASEIYRVLSPGGLLFATVWAGGLDAHQVHRALFEAVSAHLNVPLEEVALPFSMGNPDELREYVRSGGFDDVEVSAEHLTLRFPSPDRFVQLFVAGAAAAIPAFGAMAPSERAALADQIAADVSSQIREYIDGEFVSFPTSANVAVAHK